jgi:hypothetical protein
MLSVVFLVPTPKRLVGTCNTPSPCVNIKIPIDRNKVPYSTYFLYIQQSSLPNALPPSTPNVLPYFKRTFIGTVALPGNLQRWKSFCSLLKT